MLIMLTLISVFWLASISYLIFLLISAMILKSTKVNNWLLAPWFGIFCFVFYVGITGCRCVEGAAAAHEARMIFLGGSIAGAAMCLVSSLLRKEYSVKQPAALVCLLAPLYTKAISEALIEYYDLHATIGYL